MSVHNQLIPGVVIKIGGKVFRVESSVKVSVPKGVPFVKAKLKNLMTDAITEKNFKPDQEVEEVTLGERALEYLYPEGKDYLFLDVETLDSVPVAGKVVGDKAHFLKEAIPIKALSYSDTIFSIELPQFLELMVSDVEESGGGAPVSSATKLAILETGAKIDVPLFIEIGDVVKVDTHTWEYVQRI